MTTAVDMSWLSALHAACARNAALDLTSVADAHRPLRVMHAGGESFEACDRRRWRVRLLGLKPGALLVQRPFEAGAPVRLEPGTELEGFLNDGRLRWTFRVRALGTVDAALNDRKHVTALRLTLPTQVEQAQRRDYFRADVAGADLGLVKVAVLTERDRVRVNLKHNRLEHRLAGRGAERLRVPPTPPVTDPFDAHAIDLSGGGMCLSVDPAVEPLLAELPPLWVRFRIPDTPAPIVAAARVAHWHLEAGRIVVGLAFDFDDDPDHADFVADQVCRFIAERQRRELQRR